MTEATACLLTGIDELTVRESSKIKFNVRITYTSASSASNFLDSRALYVRASVSSSAFHSVHKIARRRSRARNSLPSPILCNFRGAIFSPAVFACARQRATRRAFLPPPASRTAVSVEKTGGYNGWRTFFLNDSVDNAGPNTRCLPREAIGHDSSGVLVVVVVL